MDKEIKQLIDRLQAINQKLGIYYSDKHDFGLNIDRLELIRSKMLKADKRYDKEHKNEK